MLSEALFCRLAGRASSVSDWSIVITGLLLALTLPPGFPLWMAAVAGFVAVGLGKALFGGLGYNVMNPALVGRAFLYFAYPAEISGDAVWTAVGEEQSPFVFFSLRQAPSFTTDFLTLIVRTDGAASAALPPCPSTSRPASVALGSSLATAMRNIVASRPARRRHRRCHCRLGPVKR